MIISPVYLDNNATTQMDERVLHAMLPYFVRQYGNAASKSHVFGWQANDAVEQAREQVAALVNASPHEIIFTSGATESINLALKGIFEMYAAKGNHIITCVTEHKAVLDTCHHLEKTGASISYIPVAQNGIINLQELEAAIQPTTILIAVMYGNNETGVLQPVEKIGALAKKYAIPFFSDATQAVGKIPVDVLSQSIDVMAFNAHKIHGPKGVGALYVRRKNPRIKIAAQIDGGGHEHGMRSGTLNVPGIVGFGKACELCAAEMPQQTTHVKTLRDTLEKAVLQLGESFINGAAHLRLPNTSNIAFKFIEGNALLAALNKNIAVSSGAACSSASTEPSHVLTAMGLDNELAKASIRFSVSRFTTMEEINFAIQYIQETVQQQRAESALWQLH